MGSFAFKISISCQIFIFSRLIIVSLPCDWSWAIGLSAASVVAVLGAQGGAHAMETVPCSPGLFAAPEYPGLSIISYVNPIEQARFSRITGLSIKTT
jgi:hypothetical protein